MLRDIEEQNASLSQLIHSELKPFVKKIDRGDYYAENFLKNLGRLGFFSSYSPQDRLRGEMELVEEIAKECMTTAFCLWCHLAALTYIRETDNEELRKKILPQLENGSLLGATGLSNPMKYFAGLEELHLTAKETGNGYLVSGTLPAVSNLGDGHWFGIVANAEEHKKIMCFLPFTTEGLSVKEKKNYLGVNGSATYSCTFEQVFIPNEWIISEDASAFIEKIRPIFIAYQIPLGLGLIDASIASIEKMSNRQNGCNRFLKSQAEELDSGLAHLREELEEMLNEEPLNWKRMASIRLDTVYLTLDAVQACMLHCGSSGYINESAPARRLREAYFFANLTPTVKHLEKVLQPNPEFL